MKEEINRAIKSKTLMPKIACFLMKPIGLSNNELQALQIRYRNYLYLNKKYGKYLSSLTYSQGKMDNKQNYNIWICWLQGMENAPALVKKCVASVYKYMPDFDIHVITAENIKSYIDIPTYIIEKWKKKIISNALFSDIIRTMLLIRYGGLWLDATVLLTGPVPDYVFQSDIFMYRHSYPDDITITYNNWLIYAKPNNILLESTRDLLFRYWENETTIREYFLWHLFMTMVVSKYDAAADDIFYITDELPETLSRIIFKQYDEKTWNALNAITSVHKLSNKLKIPADIKGSFYERILKS